MNQDLFNKYGKYALLEAQEHLDTICLVVENLPIYLNNKEVLKEQLEKVYRATFCLRGFFAMFNYPEPIKNYGLDKCLQIIAKSENFIISDEVLQLFLKFIRLLKNYLNLLAENPDPNTYQNLISQCETTLKILQISLNIRHL
jgi:hypothetical protein